MAETLLEIRIFHSLLLVGVIAGLCLIFRINPFVGENLAGTRRRFSSRRAVLLTALLLGYLFAPVPHEVWILVTRPLAVLLLGAALAWRITHGRGGSVA
jgi:phosphotransferase system  glucose/maltose/N-acetylglucosamine-specific IIC component